MNESCSRYAYSPSIMSVGEVIVVLLCWGISTTVCEPLECLAIICTPPKTCQVVDQIAQCLSPTSPLPSITGVPPPVLSQTNPASNSFGPAPDFCNLPPVTGRCSKSYVLWFYDAENRKCERFSYSGCGNENRFYSKAQCELTCIR
ncbi:Collagen alpha-3(VI) chain [Toxocara canis]|uniref:Collagen alpha-3(VI) chain n=1 Tax=Toxocara canis TaxID=6265 RepID=A0A0B2UTM3_TOXCA|nr:Collagen alpha-3(VI) chain [Toxocara canis]